jgi:hypothetical protein
MSTSKMSTTKYRQAKCRQAKCRQKQISTREMSTNKNVECELRKRYDEGETQLSEYHYQLSLLVGTKSK